ncbi:MAG: hypothetical protein ACOXZR_01725 [Bacilli bacterium]|jgi:hypothetical protein
MISKKNKKLFLILLTIFIIILGIFKIFGKPTCSSYIIKYLNKNGWKQYDNKRMLFVNKKDSTLFFKPTNNWLSFKLNEKDRLNVYFNEQIIYLNEKEKKENKNVYQKYYKVVEFEKWKKELQNIHNHLEEVGCPLYNIDENTLNSYRRLSIKKKE